MMLDEDLRIMDVSETSELFGIIVPRTQDKDEDEDEASEGDQGPNLISPTETIKRFEQMVYHQFLIDKSYAAVSFIACRFLCSSHSVRCVLKLDKLKHCTTGKHRVASDERRG